jgi:hypothetical protein
MRARRPRTQKRSGAFVVADGHTDSTPPPTSRPTTVLDDDQPPDVLPPPADRSAAGRSDRRQASRPPPVDLTGATVHRNKFVSTSPPAEHVQAPSRATTRVPPLTGSSPPPGNTRSSRTTFTGSPRRPVIPTIHPAPANTSPATTRMLTIGAPAPAPLAVEPAMAARGTHTALAPRDRALAHAARRSSSRKEHSPSSLSGLAGLVRRESGACGALCAVRALTPALQSGATRGPSEAVHISTDAPLIIRDEIVISPRDEIVISTPILTIWDIQTDVAGRPSWQPEVDGAEADGPLTVGSVFRWQTAGCARGRPA